MWNVLPAKTYRVEVIWRDFDIWILLLMSQFYLSQVDGFAVVMLKKGASQWQQPPKYYCKQGPGLISWALVPLVFLHLEYIYLKY